MKKSDGIFYFLNPAPFPNLCSRTDGLGVDGVGPRGVLFWDREGGGVASFS